MAAPIITLNGRWGGKLRDQNIQIVSGDDVTLEVTVFETDGSKKDITGATIDWKLSRRAGKDNKLSKTGTITDAINGVFQVAIDGTGDLGGDYYHQIKLTESGGDISTVLRGNAAIDLDTT